MDFYMWEGGGLVRTDSLWQALRLSVQEHKVIALTGAGGKTTVMFRLADEMASLGRRVIVTTTTHILRPFDRTVLLSGHAEDAKWWHKEKTAAGQGGVLVAGNLVSYDKLKAMQPEETAALRQYADVLLLEADGAKRLPLKAPGEAEPVIPDYADAVIGCMGLDSIGEELDLVCFRKELAGRLLDLTAGADGGFRHRLTPSDAAVILTGLEGTRKSVGDREFRVVLNKADHEERLQQARQTIMEIQKLRPELCAVTSFPENS